ncbi:TPA: ECF transporter S component, partial [Streptococcus suis]
GLMSMTHNTIILLPTSYLFSPFVENGNVYSIIIAVVPRILVGITPYFVYKWIKNRKGLFIAGAIGSMTNTIFVLGGIFFLFSSVFDGNIQAMLATVLGTNSIAEMIISSVLTAALVPTLQKIQK